MIIRYVSALVAAALLIPSGAIAYRCTMSGGVSLHTCCCGPEPEPEAGAGVGRSATVERPPCCVAEATPSRAVAAAPLCEHLPALAAAPSVAAPRAPPAELGSRLPDDETFVAEGIPIYLRVCSFLV